MRSDGGDHTAIHPDDGAGDVSGAFAGKKGYHVAVFWRLAQTAGGDAGGVFGLYLLQGTSFALGFRLVQEFDAAGRDASGQNDIYGNSVFGDFAGEGFGPSEQGETECIGNGEVGNGRRHSRGSAGDDAAPMTSSHIGQHAVGGGDDR